jgi:hypothetical protein
MHFIVYLKNNIKREIKTILSEIFNKNISDVTGLLEYNDTSIKYEIINLSDNKVGFYNEINVYFENEPNNLITNNLSLAIKLSSKLNCEILINDETYNPYQWILVKNSRNIFLVESKEHMDESILIEKVIGQLDLQKSLEILSGYNSENSETAYFIDSPLIWTKVFKK